MNITMGHIISTARKAQKMTQAELADKLNVTDKAVSKWEQDICYPDIALLPVLAQTLNINIEELLSGTSRNTSRPQLFQITATAVSFAMGTAVFILSILSKLNLLTAPLDYTDITGMLGLGILLQAFLHLQQTSGR